MKKAKSLSESHLEENFLTLVKSYGLPPPSQQYRFHPSRMWRFDFAWPFSFLAVEIQGVDSKQDAYSGSAHNSIVSMKRDYEKHNNAIALNWKILYFLGVDLEEPNSLQTIYLVSNILKVTPHDTNSQKQHRSTDINSIRREFDKIINQAKSKMYSS